APMVERMGIAKIGDPLAIGGPPDGRLVALGLASEQLGVALKVDNDDPVVLGITPEVLLVGALDGKVLRVGRPVEAVPSPGTASVQLFRLARVDINQVDGVPPVEEEALAVEPIVDAVRRFGRSAKALILSVLSRFHCPIRVRLPKAESDFLSVGRPDEVGEISFGHLG